MATLGILAADTASSMGLPLANVGAYAKTLREQGLIKTSGRGTSAAVMGPQDAAALLAAILSSPSIVDAAARAEQALNLPFVGSLMVPFNADVAGWEEVTEEMATGSPLNADPPYIFENALVTLLVSAANYLLSKLEVGGGQPNPFYDFWERDAVQITFGLPAPVAIVTSRLNTRVGKRDIFGGERNYEARAGQRYFDLLEYEAHLSGLEFTQARRIGTSVIKAAAASLLKPVQTSRSGNFK